MPRSRVSFSSLAAALSAVVLVGLACERSPGVAAQGGAALTADEVLPTGGVCTPSGAHGKHAFTACGTCHACGGVLQFDPAGPAAIAGGPLAAFDPVAKTCSNVACHGVPAGTFSYSFPDANGDPTLQTVAYGSGAPRPTPSWYTTGAATCTACHDDPPRDGSTGSNVWHSGTHGGQGPSGARNQCQLCHPDAYSPGDGIGTTITDATLHRNGRVDVQATFTSGCFGCH